MWISKTISVAPWTQAVTQEVTKPIFVSLPSKMRPFVLAALLFAAATALLSIGDAALLRVGFSWALVSLLVVVAAANLWGPRPASLVLALSAFYGAFVVPHMQPPSLMPKTLTWHVLALRTLVFVTCGTATIWLAFRARQMQARAERGREVVTMLRSTILPDTLADIPGYDLGGIYRPLRHEEQVGGDFYDFYPIGAGIYGLMIGDVMGKGKEAAVSTALLRYSVRAFTSMGAHPAQVIRQLNRLIDTQHLQFETASLFLGFLDTHTGTLRYANAGHEPPLLRRAYGEEETLDSTGPILGIGLDLSYEEKHALLGPGDALLLMTDGVTEARNEQGVFLGCAGAWRLLQAALKSSSVPDSLASLDSALTAYIGANRCDDVALLLLRRAPESRECPQTTGEQSRLANCPVSSPAA